MNSQHQRKKLRKRFSSMTLALAFGIVLAAPAITGCGNTNSKPSPPLPKEEAYKQCAIDVMMHMLDKNPDTFLSSYKKLAEETSKKARNHLSGALIIPKSDEAADEMLKHLKETHTHSTVKLVSAKVFPIDDKGSLPVLVTADVHVTSDNKVETYDTKMLVRFYMYAAFHDDKYTPIANEFALEDDPSVKRSVH